MIPPLRHEVDRPTGGGTRLAGKIALVTGSSRSLGKVIAARLAMEGANVVVNCRTNRQEAEDTARELGERYKVKTAAVVADVSDPRQVAQLHRDATAAMGQVDILVNNVGVSPYLPISEMTDEDWHQVMAINLHSMFYLCRAFLPPMVDQKWGRIINITGHVAFMPGARGVHTAASKGGAISFTRALATEVARDGVTANHICPGLIDTPPRQKYYPDRKPSGVPPWVDRSGADIKEVIARAVPMGRVGDPMELANVVAFLASNEASYITGQSFLVNGGMFYL